LYGNSFVFIARQHAMYTERDIVLPILSVRPSVQCRYCV